MTEIHYEIKYLRLYGNHKDWPISIGVGDWQVWDSLGTYSTVLEAIQAAIEQFRIASDQEVQLTFENNDVFPAKAGDIFWIQSFNFGKISNIANHLMIVETPFPKERRLPDVDDNNRSTFIHPKLRTNVADWNVIKLE